MADNVGGVLDIVSQYYCYCKENTAEAYNSAS
jgi:hypothetical protein